MVSDSWQYVSVSVGCWLLCLAVSGCQWSCCWDHRSEAFPGRRSRLRPRAYCCSTGSHAIYSANKLNAWREKIKQLLPFNYSNDGCRIRHHVCPRGWVYGARGPSPWDSKDDLAGQTLPPLWRPQNLGFVFQDNAGHCVATGRPRGGQANKPHRKCINTSRPWPERCLTRDLIPVGISVTPACHESWANCNHKSSHRVSIGHLYASPIYDTKTNV